MSELLEIKNLSVGIHTPAGTVEACRKAERKCFGRWMIAIPGSFLAAVIFCLTNIGNWMRKTLNRGERFL